MRDRILDSFLERQREEGLALSRASDLFELVAIDPPVPTKYLVRFHSRGMVRSPEGEIVEAERFDVGIRFGPDHLRRVTPYELVTWLAPGTVFHPNIRPPYICIGRVTPGIGLVDLIYQVFEVIGYVKVTMREDDALCLEACAWSRENKARFPIEARPLKRRALRLETREPEATR
ncbi:MAG: hypothetical protein GF346_11125 [Candidatus Eisenbacteria bacterium]|nr:hypothetical protein [Candidatus Latescibacterota bacterium]MBD3302987.1 hypothetical protein [Candidatus Eisenbacteria bacterium]